LSKTEEFWTGPEGTNYAGRNADPKMVDHNLALFRNALTPMMVQTIQRVIEFGPNIGQNIAALKRLAPFAHAHFTGVEMNGDACAALSERFPDVTVYQGSMTNAVRAWGTGYDLAMSKGVLIHVHPDELPAAYDALHDAAKRWIFVAEYHNPTPVEVPYRGQRDVLWKRDFAAEMLDRFPKLRMYAQSFAGKRHPFWPQDDLVWTLLEKQQA
jgi:pseudaminic acid biosynthesis-associated methylase